MAMQTKMEQNNFFDFENIDSFKKLIEKIRAGKSCSVFGVQNSVRAAISSAVKNKFLFVSADDVSATSAASEFELMGLKTELLLNIPDVFLYKRAGTTDKFISRSKALFNILNNNFDVVVCTAESLYSFLPSVDDFKNHEVTLKCGQNIDVAGLERKLVEAGYKREELIFEAGQFSRRGEVLDIFPINKDEPYRVDFFDTEIETIKVLDLTTMKGTKEVKQFFISPYSDLFLNEEEIKFLQAEMEKLKTLPRKDADTDAVVVAQLNEIITRLEMGDRSFSMDFLGSFLDDFRSSIFDYLNVAGNYFVVIDECKQVYDRILNFSKETGERLKELQKTGILISKLPCFFGEQEVLANFKNHTCMAFLKITNSNRFFESDAVFSIKSVPASKYSHSLKDFSVDVRNYLASGYKIFIFAGDDERAKNAQNILSGHGVNLKISKNQGISSKESLIFESGYESGFLLPDEKICVIGTYDLFAKRKKNGKLGSSRENVFSVPKVGDYVVHEYHGIGMCEGVTKLSGNFGTKDYIVVAYAGGDKLYVPTSNTDMLSRFSGAEKPARLSKLGGTDFSAVKERVKKSIRKLAFDLIELYATREKIKGFSFSEDSSLQAEFEASFPYTETEDQLKSISEIKKDMESSKVMDRLLCGDVGFGKTEVAARAMFKAISDGKQVAFIAPTTILSEQHYNTLKVRMQDFGVEIQVLNRFKTKAQADEIVKAINDGKVDLVCGTHRVLSKDVEFRNLGLIVLDEEQKFGVEDKEKLKNKYPNVDSLTLSATPIPRTLNMSLTGVRDISIISTPPSERQPVQTYVTEFSDALVVDAVKREMSRGGQVFILYNSVDKIYNFASKIKKLLPEAEVLVAHGQMPSKQLEDVIYNFYSRRADILVCTTIIENGIDIENANTLIVVEADKLGLSSLYQIRGRVGRGSKMAYAYFTYDYHKSLTEQAYKRLDAMSEFCEFGSGFKLAMRDLEIRGGGNIFGAEQSGHMQKVGFDMYSKMLSEAIKELKGEKVKETKDVLVKVKLDAFVSENYIASSEERMLCYKRISSLESLEEVEKLKSELNAVYGKIPDATLNLMDISLVRKLSSKFSAVEVNSSGNEVSIVFEKKEDITESEILCEMLFKFRGSISASTAGKPMIKFSSENSVYENFERLKKFLIKASELLNKNLT